jgi:hypothetical protein
MDTRKIAFSRLKRMSFNGTISVLTVDDAMSLFAFTRSQIIDDFNRWQTHGFGRFVWGRRGQPSRFYITSEIANELDSGCSPSIESTINSIKNDVNENPANLDSGMQYHSYRLRPNLTIELNLPKDFNDREAIRLAKFVESLPV